MTDGEIEKLSKILDSCAKEGLIDKRPNPTKTDCTNCPVHTECYEAWNFLIPYENHVSFDVAKETLEMVTKKKHKCLETATEAKAKIGVNG